MKSKIIFISSFLLMLAGWASGQSTFRNPFPGFSHTYTATVSNHASKDTRWYVTTDAAGMVKADTTLQFRFVTSGYSEPDSMLSGTGVASVEILWNPSVSAASNFYVFIEVDDEVSNCTNKMGMSIQIAADFNALVYDVTGSATLGTVVPGPSDDISEATCPDDVVDPLWNGSGHTDIGHSEIVYRVQRQFSALGWQFSYAISEGTSQAFTVDSIRFVDASNNVLSITGKTATTGGVVVSSAANYVLAYVYITNQQDMTLDIDFTLNGGVIALQDAGSNSDSNAGDNVADHTILPMPAITNFSGF